MQLMYTFSVNSNSKFSAFYSSLPTLSMYNEQLIISSNFIKIKIKLNSHFKTASEIIYFPFYADDNTKLF